MNLCYVWFAIQNKNKAIYTLLPFLVDFFQMDKDYNRRKINSKKRCLFDKLVLLFRFAKKRVSQPVLKK